ncbi:Hsp20/alpha crystallin family protein [Micromonospora purpureochromogenes]|uniref:HSP20 family protein n=1 Tax=Micromonospora purpureochromogenes TaxID=47872 RepID=A0ABX2RXN5_9ACTN|nr:Hsp20/alpha crystallin family protein [Micromonospora purpureochromogenes]NYF60059.1 HSP20 family protein [Micromonospora purpureochromogenes]
MSTITRFTGGALAPFDWTNLSLFPLLAPSIRIEDYLDGDQYVIRAEMPGIDPVKDVRITFADSELRLDVVRKETTRRDKTRSEFHYGSFSRTIPLPAGVMEKTIAARYADGMLEITAKVGDIKPGAKEIPIKIENGKKG